jgi:uncharacterized RDD family membrane protein YckC
LLDTLRYHETPEGVDLQLRLAGLPVRAAAWMIDVLIRSILYVPVFIVLGALAGDASLGFILIALFLIEWFYPVAFELLADGATPGKKRFGLRVIHDDGTPVSGSGSLIRNLLRTVDFMPYMYGLGMMTMLFNRDFKRLGDLVAGTVVVYRDTPLAYSEIPDLDPRPLPVVLSLDEQRAILDFAERRETISEQRSAELAGILADAIGSRQDDAVQALYRYANWLQRG